MIDIGRLFELLESIGIRGYEAKAYLALVEIGEAPALVIASKAGIPQPRVYEVLDSLLKKGLVEVKIGRPRTYRALPPNIALSFYARKYVDNIHSRAMRLITELSKLYSSSIREHEPLIWINYSFDSGLERAKRLIANMKYDGFLSINSHVLDRLQATISEKLKNNTRSVLAITVIGKETKEKALERIKALSRVELRRLPTGVVQMLETDLSDVMVFGENYTMHSRERELILIINEVYYFGYWRLAEPVKSIQVNRGDKFITAHHWLAMDLALRALKEGFNIKTRVRGYQVGSRRPVVIEGYIKKVVKVPEDHVRTIIVETPSREVKIGGLGASLEDVEARLIELQIE